MRLLFIILISALPHAYANQLSSKSFETEFHEMHLKIMSEFCLACLPDADPSPLVDILNRAKKAGASSFIEKLRAEYHAELKGCETSSCVAIVDLIGRALAGAGLLAVGTKYYGFTIGRYAEEIASAINDSDSSGRLATILRSIEFRSIDVGIDSNKTANFSELPDLLRKRQYRDSSVLLGVKSCKDIVPWKNKRGMFCEATTGGMAVIVPDDEFSRAVLYNAVKVGPGLLSGMIVGSYAGAPVISVTATSIQIAQFEANVNNLRPSPIERIRSYVRGQPGAIREGMTLHLAVPLGVDENTGTAKYVLYFRSDNLSEFKSPSGVSTVRIQFLRQYLSPIYAGSQITPIMMISFFADINCQESILSVGPILIDSRGSDRTPEYLSRFPKLQAGARLDEYSSIQTLANLYCTP